MKQLAGQVLLCGAMTFAACGLADGIAAATPAPRLFTGVPVSHGTRAGAASTTGIGITATTGNAQQVRVVRWATDPGDSRRRGRRRNHRHRRGPLARA